PWRAKNITWSTFDSLIEKEPAAGPSSQKYSSTSTSPPDTESTFSIEWSPCKAIPSTLWTEDASFTGVHVLGQITAFFPSITFFGPSTLSELEQLLQRNAIC
ncbi:MAG: hypothetical protein AAGD96_36585, partial [Chloroflexota bacterium]